MKPIIKHEHPTLRKTAAPVDPATISSSEIQQLLTDMSKALATRDDGVALAAPQIDVSKAIFVVSGKVFAQKGEEAPDDLVFINPRILETSETMQLMDEGCLSVDGKYGNVKRYTEVTIEAYNKAGEHITTEGNGLLGQIFQHEIDHLEGVLYIDKAEEIFDSKRENE